MFIAMGIILISMSVLKIGTLVRFISTPVMSGFTTAAACLIGLSQLKNAFGFIPAVPQQGDANTEWNYQVMQWYAYNWNGTVKDTKLGTTHASRNPYATSIFIGLYVSLILVQRFKEVARTPANKNTLWFKSYVIFANLSSFIGIIIAGKVAYDIISANYSHGKFTDYYASKLKIVGSVVPGLDIIRLPSFQYPWGQLFVDILPLTFITFMESYSIAVKLAIENNELHMLSCDQELFAIGIANVVGCVGSAYPVAGSYSRSSLNNVAGAKTPLSKAVTICSILLALGVATKTFFFIPQAALAAVIWVALYNILGFTEFWEAYKSSFKDFFVMLITFVITFVFDTSIGLAAGIGAALLVFLFETVLSVRNVPVVRQVGKGRQVIELIRLNNTLNFMTIPRIKDFIDIGILMRPDPPHAIIIDCVDVKHIDLTSLKAFEEIRDHCHELSIIFVMVNLIDEVKCELMKFNVVSDELDVDLPVLIEENDEEDKAKHYDILKKGFVELHEEPMRVASQVQSHPSLQALSYEI
jgi:SulP family sulfate permease